MRFRSSPAAQTTPHKAWRLVWIAALTIALSTGVVGCGADDPQTSNCGRFTDENWVAPDGCECRGPNGETAFIPEGTDEPVPITCEERRLQMCPSTSGIGCEIPFKDQLAVVPEDPSVVHLHVDIGGHMHDMCCNQHYSQADNEGFYVRCNGCAGKNPEGELEVCENVSFLGGLIDKPQNPDYPCAAEWAFAVQAFTGPDVFWWTQFDTEIRWTPAQAVERNLGSGIPPYTLPDDESRPLFGQSLAPTAERALDQRAPSGTFLGLDLLSDALDRETGALGLSAAQIGSFCQSERARRDADQRGWVCE